MYKTVLFAWLIITFHSIACKKDMNENGKFVLKWEDNFDSLDLTRWTKSTHGFRNNMAYFIPENAVIVNNRLRLRAKNEYYEGYDYTSAEVRSNEEFLYGKFVVKMKPADGTGLVSAFFTYTTSQPLNEIDIEMLGQDNRFITTNYWTSSKNKYSEVLELNFNASSEFAEYIIEWTPDYIKWYVNNKLIRTVTKDIPTLPQKIYMNLWISDNSDWVGEIDNSNLPVHAEFDYVKYYAYEL
jgi:beta-glucanase (GH16 family)